MDNGQPAGHPEQPGDAGRGASPGAADAAATRHLLARQRILTALSVHALRAHHLDALLLHSTDVLLDALDADACCVGELVDDQGRPVLRPLVSRGLRQALAPQIALDGRLAPLVGSMSDGPVVVRPDPLGGGLLEAVGATTGLLCPIPGLPGQRKNWGVIGAYRRRDRDFDVHDLQFTEAAGNILAAAVARLQREAELENARAQFEQAERIGHFGTYDFDIAADTNTWSDELYRIYGLSPQSLNVGYEAFMDFVHPDDREMVTTIHEEAFARGGPYQMELRILRPSGEERVLWSNGEVVRNVDGVPIRVTGMCVDVTERRRVQQAEIERVRHRSEMQLLRRQALEINDNVVQGLAAGLMALERGDTAATAVALQATLDTARTMMRELLAEASDTPVRAGDLVREAAVKPFVEQWGEPPPDHRREPADLGHEGGIDLRRPTVLVADDSPDLRFVLRLALGHEAGYDVVAEAADGETVVNLAARHRPDLVVLDLAMPGMDGLAALPGIRQASPDTKVLVLSGFDDDRTRRAAEAAGADAYAAKGIATQDLLRIAAALCPPPALPSPTTWPATAGSVAEEASAPAGDVTGAPAPSADAAAASTDPIDHLMHELRTPVTVLRGLSQTLAEEGDRLPSTAVAEIIQALHRNAAHLAAVLEATSEVYQHGQGGLDLRLEPVDLVELVHQVVADLGAVLEGHHLMIRGPERLRIGVDRMRVRQIVTNLVTNAAKFSEPGTPIAVEIRPGVTAVELAVIDSGHGVPEAHRDRLFQRFGRLGHRSAGMGLGLYLSRTIAEAHGGSLELERSDVNGSSFVLTLPTADAPATADLGA